MLVFTVQFFFGVMLFGTLVAFLDEYVFKNIQGFKFRVFSSCFVLSPYDMLDTFKYFNIKFY